MIERVNRRYVGLGICILLLCCFLGVARADRIVLAPMAETPDPNSLGLSGLLTPYRHDNSFLWLRFASAQGIELELQRATLLPDPKARYTFDVEYPLTFDFGALPAIALGVRDLFGTGDEHGALYAVVSHSPIIPERLKPFLNHCRLTAGLGTGTMDGLFIGVQAKMLGSVTLSAELYRRQPNFGLNLPVVRGMSADVASINGTIYYGFSVHIVR